MLTEKLSANAEISNTETAVWEQRWHPLREEWVVVAAHRQNRPWNGEMMEKGFVAIPEYVTDCYLCPRNQRVSGYVNEDYSGVYVFDNDLPSVGANAPSDLSSPAGIYDNRPANGIARVICYTPRHNVSLAELSTAQIEKIIEVWQKQYLEVSQLPGINHVLIFENKGEAVGVSNPHPHGQIYATNFIFKTIETEVKASKAYFNKNKRGLFEDIIHTEQETRQRIVFENERAIAFVPYFARYAYEVYVAPKRRVKNIAELKDIEVSDFAEALRSVAAKYDNMWKMSFPYVMPLHNSPTDDGNYDSFHFHIEFHPPLRKPNLLKYLAGPEIGGGNFLSDTSPEEKAAELQMQSSVHYKNELAI